jgi:hypothetical protein
MKRRVERGMVVRDSIPAGFGVRRYKSSDERILSINEL